MIEFEMGKAYKNEEILAAGFIKKDKYDKSVAYQKITEDGTENLTFHKTKKGLVLFGCGYCPKSLTLELK